jgi:3-oxoacyl-[acyl-carrier-protein] synthase-1
MEQDQVCIVALGAQTAVGLNAESTAASVRAGISGFSEHPFMINQQKEPFVLALIPNIDPYSDYHQRLIDMASAAVEETVHNLGHLTILKKIPMILGLPETRPGVADHIPATIEKNLMKLNLKNLSINKIDFLLNGHSAGLMALERGSQLILSGRSEFCLIGGVDSYADPDTLEWIEDNEQLHKPANAWGFIPGEAAGFCLICSENTAQKYNLDIRGRLIAISKAYERNRIKTETICLGRGLTHAVREVAQSLHQDLKIDFTICDQNGEAYRADEFGFMLTRLSGLFRDPSNYLAPADCWGDVGAASGPLFINQICVAADKCSFQGPYSLLWTSSEGGERVAALFKTEFR